MKREEERRKMMKVTLEGREEEMKGEVALAREWKRKGLLGMKEDAEFFLDQVEARISLFKLVLEEEEELILNEKALLRGARKLYRSPLYSYAREMKGKGKG